MPSVLAQDWQRHILLRSHSTIFFHRAFLTITNKTLKMKVQTQRIQLISMSSLFTHRVSNLTWIQDDTPSQLLPDNMLQQLLISSDGRTKLMGIGSTASNTIWTNTSPSIQLIHISTTREKCNSSKKNVWLINSPE